MVGGDLISVDTSSSLVSMQLQLQDMDDVPDIQFATTSVNVEIASSTNHIAIAEHKGYFSTFGPEFDLIDSIEKQVFLGQQNIHMLYTYRSVSQAIPEIVTIVEESDNKKAEINRKMVDIIRPEMWKIKELQSFVMQAVTIFNTTIQHLNRKEANKEMVPIGVHMSLIKLMDVLLILDNLKDMKTCLQKDFSRYKRVIGAHPPMDLLEEINSLQLFISNPDPKKAKNFIFLTLRDEVKRVANHEKIIIDTIELAIDTLDPEVEMYSYLCPDEKFRLLRVLPYLMLIADDYGGDNKSFNIFKTNKLRVSVLQKLLRKNPIVPLYGDMSLTLEFIFHNSSHYDRQSMGASWGSDPDNNNKVVNQYDLKTHWEGIRDNYNNFSVSFNLLVNKHKFTVGFKKELSEETVETAKEVFQMVSVGLKHLSNWTTMIHMMLAWKYTHPCSIEQLHLSKDSNNNNSKEKESDGVEYERVLRNNLSQVDRSVLVDVISMVKSLSSCMLKAEAQLAPFIRFHIHHHIQQLVQGDLTPLLHRLDKRNKPILPSLLKLRSLAADWLSGSEPRNDYRDYTRKQGSVFAAHIPRVVSTASTQLYILRTQVCSLCDSESEVRKKASVFAKADLETSDVQLFEKFYIDSFYFPYLLNFSETLRSVSDLGNLWFREFFLEMTRCIQFPIEFSLPWILTEHLISNRICNSPPMIENVLFVLDIYNDAAHNALYVLNQQYLYDEIEAEVNLVIDQLYFLLSDEIYNYFKNLASSSLLEKSFKNKMEELKGSDHLSTDARRIETLMEQKHIQLLGRSINLSFILGQNINNKIYRDIDLAINRFESWDCRGICDLKILLDLLSDTHSRISQYLQLDSFDNMLNEINESVSPSTSGGRIGLHMLRSLVNDLFPNFNYNNYTERFVPSPIPIRPATYGKAPKQSAVNQAYGSVCCKAHEMCGKLHRGFFGRIHMESYLSLGLGITEMSTVVDQCMRNLYDKLSDVSEYMEALKSGIPPCKPPSFQFAAVGGYGFYEGKLKTLLSYDDLKPEVFQNFREIGNTVVFLRDLSLLLEISEQFTYMTVAPLLGVTPSQPTRDNNNNNNNNNNSSPEIEPILEDLSRSLESKSLFKWVMKQVEEYLFQLNLTVSWAVSNNNKSSSPYFVLEVDNATSGFYRLWSALSFLFCITESSPADVEGDNNNSGILSNEAEFGHGFTVAGTILLHLLGQRNIFELLDFSSHVLRIHSFDEKKGASVTSPVTNVDKSLLKDTKNFIVEATFQRQLQSELFSFFEAQYTPRSSYNNQNNAIRSKIFRPPKENK